MKEALKNTGGFNNKPKGEMHDDKVTHFRTPNILRHSLPLLGVSLYEIPPTILIAISQNAND